MPTYSSNGRDDASRRSGQAGRRRSSGSGSSRQSQRRQARSGSSTRGGSRGRNSRNDSLRSNRNYRTLSGNDTGFTLRQRQINFAGAPGSRSNRASFILLGAAVVVLVLLIFGISSCVRGCSSRSAGSDDGAVNSQDARIAAGATPEITSKLTPALDAAEALERIADNADKYSDSRMIDLAVTVPEATNFVANYPTADHTNAAFNDVVTQGNFPQLYDWDTRWGYTDYADGAFGVTGSGPTVLAMAYMGLTGSSGQTPYSMGQAITAAGLATGETGLDKGFFDNTQLAKVGLSANSYQSTTDDLEIALSGGTPAAVLVRANTLTNYAHWVLVTGYADDGSVYVNDPTSTSVSSHTWAAGTVVGSAESVYAISATTQSSSDSDSDSSSSSSSQDSDGDYDSDYDSDYDY